MSSLVKVGSDLGGEPGEWPPQDRTRKRGAQRAAPSTTKGRSWVGPRRRGEWPPQDDAAGARYWLPAFLDLLTHKGGHGVDASGKVCLRCQGGHTRARQPDSFSIPLVRA
jgi:hypothetical protein